MGDDQAILLEGVACLLEPEFEVVGLVSDGPALVEAARRIRPDVVIVDIPLPILNGLDAARMIHRELPSIRIVFLTAHDDPAFIEQAFDAGAQAYVVKRHTSEELVTALHHVLRGEQYVCAADGARSTVPTLRRNPGSAVNLTIRQRQIVQLIAEGKQNKEIATVLNLSPRTVEFHKARIMNKLKIRSTAGLTRFAMRHGIAAE
jgi:DNA-binding NarL/FixJ family response regulator